MDYLPRTDRHIFKNSSVHYPWNNYDHYLVLGCLHGTAHKEQSRHLRLEVAMEAAGLEEVDTYIQRRQNTISQYITTNLLLEMCLEAEM